MWMIFDLRSIVGGLKFVPTGLQAGLISWFLLLRIIVLKKMQIHTLTVT